MTTAIIPRKYKELLETIGVYANKLGMKAWVVGGAVRDFYLHKDTLDIDLSFEGNPEPVAGFCVRTWGGQKRKFSQFGTFRVNLQSGLKLDLVRARKEHYEHPGALPVVEPSTIKDDLFRRDFTSNAWAFSILPQHFGQYYDPFGAKKDIDAGLIRVLHDKSFLDDPTRMCRAVRFAGRFGWKLAPKTEKLLYEAVEGQYPLVLTRERLIHEFLKVMKEKQIKEIFDLMQQYDMLKYIYPSFAWHDAYAKHKNVDERVGIMVCSMGSWGEAFLRTLHLRKELSQEILGAWQILEDQKSPTGYLSPLQHNIIRAMMPGIKKTALEPCFLKGRELKEMGFSGRKISGVLDKLCKMQWDGKVSSREQAVASVEKEL